MDIKYAYRQREKEMLSEEVSELVQLYRQYLEHQGAQHRGGFEDAAILSYYNGILTALEGLVDAEDLNLYVESMVALVKAGSDEILGYKKMRRN